MVNQLDFCGVSVDLNRRRVIDGVTLSLRPGRMMALVGPNGAGKSTLLRAALGLLPLAAGQITLDGTPVSRLEARARARQIAYLPQGHQAIWPVPVARIVALGRLPHRAAFAPASTQDAAAVALAMARAEITDFAARAVCDLSGGERARVMLARALAVEAGILLADEPVAALDPRHQLQVMTLLRGIADAGTAVICVLHDLGLAARFCDEVAVLDDGRLTAAGPPETALSPEVLRRTYGIEPYLARHEGQPVILPWDVLA